MEDISFVIESVASKNALTSIHAGMNDLPI